MEVDLALVDDATFVQHAPAPSRLRMSDAQPELVIDGTSKYRPSTVTRQRDKMLQIPAVVAVEVVFVADDDDVRH